MKNILKKNQVIITALAIMIAIAGYLTYTQDKINPETVPASNQQDITDVDTTDVSTTDVDSTDIESADTDIEDVENSNVIGTTMAPGEEKKTSDAENGDGEVTDISDADELDNKEILTVEDTNEVTSESNSSVGDAVLANSTIGSTFFNEAKLKREQIRAKNKEELKAMIEDQGIKESQKQTAIDEMIELTENSEKEAIAETLLEAKGFPAALVTITDDQVDVVVDATNLSEQQMAQIEDVVKRKTGIAAKNITISPAIVSDEESSSVETQNNTKKESDSSKDSTQEKKTTE